MTNEELLALSEMHRKSFVGDYGLTTCEYCKQKIERGIVNFSEHVKVCKGQKNNNGIQ